MTTAGFGLTSLEPLAFYDPGSSCWRMFRATLFEDFELFSGPLPRSGMTRGGFLFELPMSGHRTGVSDCSSLLKTPTAQLAVNGGSQHPDKRKQGGHGPTLADEVEHLLPTPTATPYGSNQSESSGAAVRPSLNTLFSEANTTAMDVATASANTTESMSSASPMPPLPTPTAGDAKSTRNSTATRHRTPPTGIHAGNTLTDALVPKPPGACTNLRYDAGDTSSDAPPLIPPNPTLDATDNASPHDSSNG